MKKYLVKVYPQPLEFEVEAENEIQAEDKAIHIWTPNSCDVYNAVATEIEDRE